jgi:hypothetical protein
MPDQNEIVYTQYGLDIGGPLAYIYNLVIGSGSSVSDVVAFFWGVWQVVAIISFILSGLFLFGYIYAKLRIAELDKINHHALHHAEEEYAHASSHISGNKRWLDALAHTESENPNDWRLAIIEADIMLEELLGSLGFAGLTIGDKLKRASPQFFKSIDEAWAAHKVRNEIAHRGTDFVLTKRLTKETIEKYRRVFDEFSII